jgi:hypothetical protein
MKIMIQIWKSEIGGKLERNNWGGEKENERWNVVIKKLHVV